MGSLSGGPLQFSIPRPGQFNFGLRLFRVIVLTRLLPQFLVYLAQLLDRILNIFQCRRALITPTVFLQFLAQDPQGGLGSSGQVVRLGLSLLRVITLPRGEGRQVGREGLAHRSLLADHAGEVLDLNLIRHGH